MPVLVLGMHRSGTSAATRLAGFAGLALDETADLMPAAASNPKGHWESVGLVQCNDGLLAALGGDWSAPPSPMPPDELIAALRPWRAAAAGAFRRAMPTAQWVWKDPRTCLLAPFWLDLLADEQPAVVLITRDPLEVACSLQRRDGFPLHHGVALWERYNRAALAAAAGRPTFLTRYEDLLDDPVGWVGQLRELLRSLDTPLGPAADPAEVTGFVDRSLRHAAGAVDTSAVLTGAQHALQAALDDAVGLHAALPELHLPPPAASSEALLEARRSAIAGPAGVAGRAATVPGSTPVVVLARADRDELSACLRDLPEHVSGAVVADNPGLVATTAAAHGLEVLPARPDAGPATLLSLAGAQAVAVLPSWARVTADLLGACEQLLQTRPRVGAIVLAPVGSAPVGSAPAPGADVGGTSVVAVPLDATVGGWPTMPCVLRRAALADRGLGELARCAAAGQTLAEALRGWDVVDGTHLPGWSPQVAPNPTAAPPLAVVEVVGGDDVHATEQRLRRLAPVVEAVGAEVVIVDDGAGGGTDLLLACLEGHVRVLTNAVALGPAASRRLAAGCVRAPVVCVIDGAVPSPEDLQGALMALREDPSAPVVRGDGWTVARREALAALAGTASTSGPQAGAPPASPTSPASEPAVSIIIPLFNQVEYTERCLQAIAEHTPPGSYEVVLVDNASRDATPQLLAALEGDLQVITNPVNRGYAVACNQGAAAARGRHLLFLNNDTEVTPGWLDPLLSAIQAPDVGAVGARLLFPDGTIQHAGVELVLHRDQGRLAGVHRLYRQPADHPDALRAADVEVVTGALMLVRREAFAAAGGFDERYWNGNEDVDLCLSLRALGWRVRYEPACCIVHHESVSGPERFSGIVENDALLTARWAATVMPAWIVEPDGSVRTSAGQPAG